MKNNPYTVFYGYRAEELAAWCYVSIKYAQDLKSGSARPSRRILEIFQLYSNQQILGKEWTGWRCDHERLYTPENVEITQSDIRALPYLRQLHAELTRNKRGLQYEGNTTDGVVLDFRKHVRLRAERKNKS